MRIGVDSSVIVAVVHANHPLHRVAGFWFNRVLNEDELFICEHSVLESYAVLTRLPGKWRLTADETDRLLRENVKDRMTTVQTPADSVWPFVGELATQRIVGGRSYDAHILYAMRRAGITEFATFNPSHFEAIDPRVKIIDPARTPVG